MKNKYETNSMIDNYIEKLATSGLIRSFYPNAINKALNTSLTPVLERLNRFVEDEVLILKFEIRCHEGSHIIDIVSDYGNCLGKYIYCKFCDDEIYVDIDNISPIYYINDDYKEYVKKKSKSSAMKNQMYQSQNLMVMV